MTFLISLKKKIPLKCSIKLISIHCDKKLQFDHAKIHVYD